MLRAGVQPTEIFYLLSICSRHLYGASLVAQMVKNLPAMQETQGWIPGLRISPGEGNGNSLQCSCLENPMDRGVRWATVYGVTKSHTRLSN